MLQWLKELLLGREMTHEERIQAILCRESMLGQQLFYLDKTASEKLIKEYGCPARVADGTRLDN